MVQILPPKTGVGHGIVSGLAEGLSQSLPREIERGRLSAGLKNLGQQDFSNKSPLEQLAAISAIPGMTPELQAQAMQYVQNQNALKAAQQQYGGSVQGQAKYQQGQLGQQTGIPQQVQQQGGQTQQQFPSSRENRSNYGLASDEGEIQRAALALQAQNPAKYRKFQEYVDEADKVDAKRVAKDLLFEQRTQDALNTFRPNLEKLLQKQNISQDIPGNLQRKYEEGIANDVAKGMTGQQASQKWEREAEKYAKNRNKLEALGSWKRFFTSESDMRKNLETARDEYARQGQLEAYKDDLIATQKMTPAYANYLAFPPKENKAVNNIVANVPKLTFKHIQGGTAEKNYRKGADKKTIDESKIAKDVFNSINGEDSILSIALALKGRGYDQRKFLDEMYILSKERPDRLTPRQDLEFADDRDFKPSLGDLNLFAKSGLDPLIER